MLKYLLGYLLLVNIVAFILYGSDKRKGVKNKWRTPESVLVIVAWIGGAVGALAGMLVFHHKTRKWKFRILIPAALIVWIAAIYLLTAWTGILSGTSAERLQDKFSGSISQIHSSVDMDGDGIDDQTDILQGALDYVETEPIYFRQGTIDMFPITSILGICFLIPRKS